MTYLSAVPPDVDNVVRLPRYGRHVPSAQPAADGRSAQAGSVTALVRTVLRSWRQAIESQGARHHLMQLDDHLLSDVGLTRTDLHFADFETLGRHRRAGGIR